MGKYDIQQGFELNCCNGMLVLVDEDAAALLAKAQVETADASDDPEDELVWDVSAKVGLPACSNYMV